MSCEIGASFCTSLSLSFSSYALTLERRTAQRNYGPLDAWLARISTTRSWHTLWGHRAPITDISSHPSDSASCRKCKHASQPTPPPPSGLAGYFPTSYQHMFSPLPFPPTHSPTLDMGVSDSQFPHNVSFRRADWANKPISEDETCYDVVVAWASPANSHEHSQR